MTLNQVQQAQPHPSPFPGFTLPRKPLPTLSAVSASIALNYVLFLELFSQGLPADFLLCDLHTCPHPSPISAFLSLFLPNIYVLMFRPTQYSLICINTIMYVDIIHRCRTCLVVVEINVLFLICFVFSMSSPSSSPTSTRSVNSSQFFLLVAFPWEPCIFWTARCLDLLCICPSLFFPVILGLSFISLLCGNSCALDPMPFSLSSQRVRTGINL